MTISNEDSAAATAAISALGILLTTYAAQPGLTAKDNYAGVNMLTPIWAARPLALSLGETLLAEQMAAAESAIAPYCADAVEQNRVLHEFGVMRALRGQINGLAAASQEPGSATNNARLVIAIFTKCLAAAE